MRWNPHGKKKEGRKKLGKKEKDEFILKKFFFLLGLASIITPRHYNTQFNENQASQIRR
jgi:hypothetical protein